MTSFRISPAVAVAFPDTLIALVTATGLRGHEPWPDTVRTLEDLEQQLAAESLSSPGTATIATPTAPASPRTPQTSPSSWKP